MHPKSSCKDRRNVDIKNLTNELFESPPPISTFNVFTRHILHVTLYMYYIWLLTCESKNTFGVTSGSARIDRRVQLHFSVIVDVNDSSVRIGVVIVSLTRTETREDVLLGALGDPDLDGHFSRVLV